MRNKLIAGLSLSAAIISGGVLDASAHGYVESPISRGYQGSLDKNTLGWSAAFEKYGQVITNPQSLEAKKGFPEFGPIDGRIASAEGGSGQIGDSVLDEAGFDRWKKQELNTGMNTFTWTFTAAHSTAKYHYYITKNGWDPTKPLSRESLELLKEVPHDGSSSKNNPTHQVNIPADHSGYHIILAVWDVADTPNAFYNVIDVNIKNGQGPEIITPDKPTNIAKQHVTADQVSLKWNSDTKAKAYNIYRDGKKIDTVSASQFTDKNVKPKTSYAYQIEAVSYTNTLSEKSDIFKVTTESIEGEIAKDPTAPAGLHSMGTTASSVSLMWTASYHQSGIKEYEIYRDGEKIAVSNKIHFLDNNLSAKTTYNYQVVAVSNSGSSSLLSEVFTVTTLSDEVPGSEYPEWKVGTHTQPLYYAKGDIVSYKGKLYETINTHNNYGDSTWAPDNAITLFKLAK